MVDEFLWLMLDNNTEFRGQDTGCDMLNICEMS